MKIFAKDSVDSENGGKSLEYYLYLNIKMLSAMSVFVGFNGKTDFSMSGYLTKVPILAIITLLFSTVDGLYQIWLVISLMSSDKKAATLICTNVFSIISCVTKGYRLSTTINDLQNVLDDLLKMWNENHPTGPFYDKIIRKADKTLLFVKGYICMIIGLIMNVGLPPIIHMVSQYLTRESLNYTYDYSVRLLAMEYPFKINNGSIFYSVMCKEYWILFGLTLFWVSGDTLFASLITHLSLQFEILENDINIYVNYETDEQRLKKNLIAFVSRHREILRMCREVERIFSPIVFVNVVVSSMNICVNMYMLQEAAVIGAYSDVTFHFFLTFNTLLQITVYCIFVENLTQRTIKISESIYDSEWADKNQDFRKCLQILLTNAQKPFYCTAYGFFALTHEQFTKIVKAATSYYMMLRTTT